MFAEIRDKRMSAFPCEIFTDSKEEKEEVNWLLNIPVDVLEHIISFGAHYLKFVNKYLVSVCKGNAIYLNGRDEGSYCPFETNITQEEYLNWTEERKSFITLGPSYSPVFSTLFYQWKKPRNVHGLAMLCDGRTSHATDVREIGKFVLKMHHVINCCVNLRFLFIKGMLIGMTDIITKNHQELEVLHFKNCYVCYKYSDLISTEINLKSLIIKKSYFADYISFPRSLLKIEMDIYCSELEMKRICRCNNLEYLDLKYNRSILNNMENLPASLQEFHIRSVSGHLRSVRNKLVECFAVLTLTGYRINNQSFESAERISGYVMYYKYLFGNTVVILHM